MKSFEDIKKLIVDHENLILFIIFFLSLCIRFIYLGRISLSDNEAILAFQSLNSIKGETITIGGQSGYVGLTSLLFLIFEGNDFFARFWPALFGSCIILVPLLYNDLLGRKITFFLTILLAFDPGLIGISRIADGTIIAATALFAGWGFYRKKKIIISAAIFGIALISSPNIWPLILAGGLAILVIGKFKLFEQQDLKNSKPLLFLISLIITIAIISTQFFTIPNGISGIGSGLTDYINSWIQTSDFSIKTIILIWFFSELPIIIFGVWGIISGFINKSKITVFITLWWGIGMILLITNPSRTPMMLAYTNIPLIILAAFQLANIFEIINFPNKIIGIVQSIATFTLIIFSILNFLNMVNFPSADADAMQKRLIGTLLPICLLVIFTLLLAWGWNQESTKNGLLIGLLLLLGFYYFGSSWKVTGLGSRPETEFYSNGQFVTSKTALYKSITDISRWNTGQATSIDVMYAELDSPSLRWMLRDFPNIFMETSFPKNTSPSIMISPTIEMVQSQTQYRGQKITWAEFPNFSQMTLADWVKWTFLRKIPVVKTDIILWVRNDLFLNSATQ